MNSESNNIKIKTNSENNNFNIGELFEFIKTRNQDKIKEYIANPEFKVWQLKDKNGYTILHKSVYNSDFEITELIINETKSRLGLKNINLLKKFINEKTSEGLTALHYAANKGNIEIFKFLRKNEADVNEVTNLGKNVLHMAAEGNQPSMIIYLITEEKLSPQSIDENGSSPLHWACYFGSEEAVNFLLYLDANINQQDKEKITPLHLAVNEGKENIVIKLLQKNADRYLPNIKGELPIDLARKKNYIRIEQILAEDNINPLFSIQMPMYYVEPKDVYKKLIILMLVLPEVIIFFFVWPYLQEIYHPFVNLLSFIVSLVSYIIFVGKDPGYKNDIELIKDAGEKYPLILKVKDGIDVRNYCPKCYIQKGANITHCFECDKCVEEFSHHCFWINKCIAKKNLVFYFCFIFFTLLYSNYSLYICLELLFDDVNLPYDKKYLDVPIFNKYRGFKVLGASAVGVFSLLVGLPLWFLFLIEIFKKFGCLKKNKNIIESQLQEIILRTNSKNPEKLINEPSMVEMKIKGDYAIEDDEEKEGLLDIIGDEDYNEINAINDYKNSFGSNPLEDIDDKNNYLEDIDDNKNKSMQLIENGENKSEEVKEKLSIFDNKEEEKNLNEDNKNEEKKEEEIINVKDEENKENNKIEENNSNEEQHNEDNEEQKQEENNNNNE